MFEDGRAVGVTAHHAGADYRVRADLLVGADGRRSLVASEVGAEEYLGYDAPRAMYLGVLGMPGSWRTDRYPFDMYIGHVGETVRVAFQTDHDQLLLGSLPPVHSGRDWKVGPTPALTADLAKDELTRDLVGGRRPESPVRGTLKERYFFRRGAGPGWALLGDAGHHEEFVVGDGITEALLQARGLAAAIQGGGDRALDRWWRQRDVDAMPGYFWGRDEGRLGTPTHLQTAVVRTVARSERLQAMISRLPEHRCSPYDALPAGAIVKATLGALLRGHFGVIGEIRTQKGRMDEYVRALAERVRLLEAVEA